MCLSWGLLLVTEILIAYRNDGIPSSVGRSVNQRANRKANVASKRKRACLPLGSRDGATPTARVRAEGAVSQAAHECTANLRHCPKVVGGDDNRPARPIPCLGPCRPNSEQGLQKRPRVWIELVPGCWAVEKVLQPLLVYAD